MWYYFSRLQTRSQTVFTRGFEPPTSDESGQHSTTELREQTRSNSCPRLPMALHLRSCAAVSRALFTALRDTGLSLLYTVTGIPFSRLVPPPRVELGPPSYQDGMLAVIITRACALHFSDDQSSSQERGSNGFRLVHSQAFLPRTPC